MGSDRKLHVLRDLGGIVTGKTPKTAVESYFNGMTPFVTPTDFDGRRRIGKTLRTLTSSGVDAVRSSLVPAESVMVTCIGSDMGKVALSAVASVTNQQINTLVVNPRHDARYVYYNLSGRRAELRALAAGSAQPILNKSSFGMIEIELPTRSEQSAVADVLSALDDRIDLLRQTNTTLEAIAQALFKSWFVDFDPVHAKAEGREPEAMDAATADLFPSEFEESELGLIPKSWSVKRLSDLVELAYGKALKASERVAGEIPVYGSGGVTGWHDAALVKEPTIIIGRKGSVGTIYWEDRPCHPIDTVFFVRSQKAPLTLCLQVLRSLGLDKMNTDAAVPGLNRENAYRLEIVAAPTAVNDAWHKIAEPTYVAMSNNSRCCEVLSQLRDTLLPRLISGKLRLPEATETVEAVPHEYVGLVPTKSSLRPPLHEAGTGA